MGVCSVQSSMRRGRVMGDEAVSQGSRELCRLHGTLFHSQGDGKPLESIEQGSDVTRLGSYNKIPPAAV